MRLLSLFDGSAGFPLAAAQCGIEPVMASEVEPYPIAVSHSRFPRMLHLGDVARINGRKITPVDVITFGSPCFPAGTLALTSSGYKPIENVTTGDYVLTHRGRWKKVLAAGSKVSETVVLKGNHFGLECTPNHPIYSRARKHSYPSRNGVRAHKIVLLDRQWTRAENMKGLMWAVPRSVEPLPADVPTPSSKKQNPMPNMNEDFWYYVGRWIGDGWIRDGQRPDRPEGQCYSTIYLCDSHDKEDELIKATKSITAHYSCEREKNTVKVKFTNELMCEWLKRNFGKGAHNKTIAPWVFGIKPEYREALLYGVFDSDGYKVKGFDDVWRVSTVSHSLAESLRILGELNGYSTTIFVTEGNGVSVIDGREVDRTDYYTVAFTGQSGRKKTHFFDELHSWYLVKSVENIGESKTVYNLEVEGDNSYVANGIVVHNCQDLSVAGKRAGLKHAERGDEETTRSGLFMEAIRIIKEMRDATNGRYPTFAVWENVVGAFSSNKGEDFRIVLEEFVRVVEPSAEMPAPDKGKWPYADAYVGDGWSVAYRTLDAQYWGVPQRRRRIYLVADFRGERASKVLFERDGLRGYPAQGGTQGETPAPDPEGSTGAADRAFTLQDREGKSGGGQRPADPGREECFTSDE